MAFDPFTALLISQIVGTGVSAIGAGVSARASAKEAAVNRALQEMMFRRNMQQRESEFSRTMKQRQTQFGLNRQQAQFGRLSQVPTAVSQFAALGRPNFGR